MNPIEKLDLAKELIEIALTFKENDPRRQTLMRIAHENVTEAQKELWETVNRT